MKSDTKPVKPIRRKDDSFLVPIILIGVLVVVCVAGSLLVITLPISQSPIPQPALKQAWVSGIVDCPTAPDYGKQVASFATVYDENNHPTGKKIPHGAQVDILKEAAARDGMHLVRYSNQTGYIQAIMVVDYDPSKDLRPKPDDCFP